MFKNVTYNLNVFIISFVLNLMSFPDELTQNQPKR